MSNPYITNSRRDNMSKVEFAIKAQTEVPRVISTIISQVILN